MSVNSTKFHLQQAIKIGITSGITTACVYWLHLHHGFLAVISCFALMSFFYSELIEKSLERFLGPLLAVLLSLLVWPILPHSLLLYTIALVIGLFIFAYAYFSKILGYAALLGTLTFGFLLLVAYQHSYTDARHLGFDWLNCILLGAVVSIVVQFSFWRKHTPPHFKLSDFTSEMHTPHWNKHITQSSVKTCLCIVILLLFNHAVGWGAISLQCLITATVVTAQPNLGRSYQRAIQRIAGALALKDPLHSKRLHAASQNVIQQKADGDTNVELKTIARAVDELLQNNMTQYAAF